MLFKSAKGEECENEFKKVTETYNCDLDKDLLETQLLLFRAKWKKEFKGDKIVLYDIVEFMRQDGYCDLLSEVSTVLQLILVLPATNAECERCFSCLKRVKTYLKNALSQKKLNHLMILNIFEEETEELNLAEVANDFFCQCDKRKEDFGYREFV